MQKTVVNQKHMITSPTVKAHSFSHSLELELLFLVRNDNMKIACTNYVYF
jgi:hypothetical protein